MKINILACYSEFFVIISNDKWPYHSMICSSYCECSSMWHDKVNVWEFLIYILHDLLWQRLLFNLWSSFRECHRADALWLGRSRLALLRLCPLGCISHAFSLQRIPLYCWALVLHSHDVHCDALSHQVGVQTRNSLFHDAQRVLPMQCVVVYQQKVPQKKVDRLQPAYLQTHEPVRKAAFFASSSASKW